MLYGDFSSSYLQSRKEHVLKSYPKIQYLFSDVICYVTNCNWREPEYIAKQLLEWAKESVTGVLNVPVKPKLLIIFNKTDISSVKGINATEVFFDELSQLFISRGNFDP